MSNCPLSLADASHEFQIHMSVHILTIKISQRARVNFCIYRKIAIIGNFTRENRGRILDIVMVPSPSLHHVVQLTPDGYLMATPYIFSRCARFSLFWSLDSKAKPCRSVLNTFTFIASFLRDVRHSDHIKICAIVSSHGT